MGKHDKLAARTSVSKKRYQRVPWTVYAGLSDSIRRPVISLADGGPLLWQPLL